MTKPQAAALALASATLGWWTHSTRPVHAEQTDLRFEFHDLSPHSALSVYNSAEQTIYVYQGATQGFSTLQCSYKFHIPHPGAPIERQNCPVGTVR